MITVDHDTWNLDIKSRGPVDLAYGRTAGRVVAEFRADQSGRRVKDPRMAGLLGSLAMHRPGHGDQMHCAVAVARLIGSGVLREAVWSLAY